jgi:hypothetical protein
MKNYLLFLLFALSPLLTIAQIFVASEQTEKIPSYTLPDPLIFNNGEQVKTKTDWVKRRKEIYRAFETEVYGITPRWQGEVTSTILSTKNDIFGGLGKQKQIRVIFSKGGKNLSLTLLLFLPKQSKKAPLFLSYNFDGNHTTTADQDIIIPDCYMNNKPEIGVTNHQANKESRGLQASRWPIKEILSRGYGVATAYYGEIDPDFDDGFKNGIHQLFDQKRDSASWGSVATWAWGLSRIMDYLEKDQDINPRQVIVMGHSRLGKAALWAGASDKRFAMVVSNCSGCSGAALSKRIFGETVEKINNSFPHWFCNNYKKFNSNEQTLTIDQHELLALIAPRPVYVASASEDLHADPKGEFLSCVYASSVYELLGSKKFPATIMPQLSAPIYGHISYHIRPGKHDVTIYDWNCYMDVADLYFKRKK